MKIKCLAVFLSLSVLTLTSYASEQVASKMQQPSTVTKQININQADLTTLSGSFKGIGKKRAQAILDYRESHKGFKSLEELADVKGLGQKFVDANRVRLKEVFIIK